MSRSKRLSGVANAAPTFLGHLKGGGSAPEVELFESLIFELLVANVLANQRLVPTYRRDEVPPRPKVLPHKIALSFAVDAGEVDSTFTLDLPDHL